MSDDISTYLYIWAVRRHLLVMSVIKPARRRIDDQIGNHGMTSMFGFGIPSAEGILTDQIKEQRNGHNGATI